MKKIILVVLMGLISGQSFGQLSKKTEYLKVNGLDMYYEVYGEGEPLLLLHGWTQSSSFWSEYIPTYAKHYKVYAIDLRGHGRTSQLTADFSIKKSAKDILELIDHLKIKKAKAIGLSLTLPKSFVEELKIIHYHGEAQIKALFNPNLEYQIKLKDEDLNAFNFRTLIVHGDRDEILGVDPAIALHKNIPNSELWIVPNTGHIAITEPNLDAFLTNSLQFLNMDNENKTDANKK